MVAITKSILPGSIPVGSPRHQPVRALLTMPKIDPPSAVTARVLCRTPELSSGRTSSRAYSDLRRQRPASVTPTPSIPLSERATASSTARATARASVPQVRVMRAVQAGRPPLRQRRGDEVPVQSPIGRIWAAYLDNPEKDTEMKLGAVFALLTNSGFLNNKQTYDSVLTYLESAAGIVLDHVGVTAALSDRRATLKPKAVMPKTTSINFAQFSKMLEALAQQRGISYAECVATLSQKPLSQRAKIATVYAKFAHGTAQGLMTVYEFTRFCHFFELFVPRRFIEGDVHFIFRSSHEGKAVDFNGFLRLLEKVADKLGQDVCDLHSMLAMHADERVLPVRAAWQ